MDERLLTGLPPSRWGAPSPAVRIGSLEAGLAWAFGDSAGAVGVVLDPAFRGGPVAEAIRRVLGGRATRWWTDVRPDPRFSDAERAAEGLSGVAWILAVGGGSALDLGKAAALRLGRDAPCSGLRGRIEGGSPPPLVLAPTTAGTGSEVQSFALLSRDEDAAKVAVGHVGMMPRRVVLDPMLAASAPRPVALAAGIDALVHAVEAAVSTASGPAAREAALRALGRLWGALPAALGSPDDPGPRREMAEGALWAGAAIEAGMLGAAHAAANALTASCGVPHGLAVGMTLAHVMRWACEDGDPWGEAAAAIGLDGGLGLATAWEARLRALGAPRDASAWSAPPGGVDALVEAARGQWTGRFSPRPVDDEGLRRVLGAVLADASGR